MRSSGGRSALGDDWEKFSTLSDAEVRARALSDPDALPTDPAFWKNAKIVLPQKKVPTSVRLDDDVLSWFRARGKGYQTLINAVLRTYMQAHRR